jgi:hypothetical protein
MTEYVQAGLATDPSPQSGLEVDQAWDNWQLNQWFRTLLPKAWNYLSKTHPFILKDSEEDVMVHVKHSDWPYLLVTRARGPRIIESILHPETTPLTGNLCMQMSTSRAITVWRDRNIFLGDDPISFFSAIHDANTNLLWQ